MRLTVIALMFLPMGALAQDKDAAQSCPVGMVWDGGAQTCVMAVGDGLDLPDHVDCQSDAVTA